MKKVIFIISLFLLLSCGDNEDGGGNTLSAPTLIYPIDETECSNTNLQFEWNTVADSSGEAIIYDLYIDVTPNFGANTQIHSTYYTYYSLSLSQSTHYYWKIKARNNSTSSEFSEIRSLYTQGTGATNTIPLLEYINPQNNATMTGSSVTTYWQGTDVETSNNNLRYRVYFAEDTSDFNLYENEYYNTQYTFNGLNSGATYKWIIYVTDEDGATSVGDVYRFTVN